ncbi:MAG: hypothetical protein IJO45_07290 [Oscillospiraceae bacterium]|nr:hypothetical protein [Oscillospiraceae bacterium]
MNPLISLLLIALGAIGVVVLIALICSVVLLAGGKRYSQKQFEMLKDQITQLLDGDAALAEELLEGKELPEDCRNREKISQILEAYRAEQERIRRTAEDNQKKRPQKGRVMKFLTEKKDKGEWI